MYRDGSANIVSTVKNGIQFKIYGKLWDPVQRVVENLAAEPTAIPQGNFSTPVNMAGYPR